MKLVVLLFFATPAFAYIDPASGSAIISAIVGILAAVSMTIKTYWYKLKNLFSFKKPKDE